MWKKSFWNFEPKLNFASVCTTYTMALISAYFFSTDGSQSGKKMRPLIEISFDPDMSIRHLKQPMHKTLNYAVDHFYKK